MSIIIITCCFLVKVIKTDFRFPLISPPKLTEPYTVRGKDVMGQECTQGQIGSLADFLDHFLYLAYLDFSHFSQRSSIMVGKLKPAMRAVTQLLSMMTPIMALRRQAVKTPKSSYPLTRFGRMTILRR